MATRAALKVQEAFMQYSKKMCTRVTIFWMLYRLANFLVLMARPDLGNALADLCTGVDTVMIVNMGAYTANSSTEKVATAYAQRKSLYDRSNNASTENEDASEETEEASEEEFENG